MNKPMILQDVFLNQARREHTPVSVRMMDGMEIAGTVKGFDSFTVILDDTVGCQRMLYKHAIAAVAPRAIGKHIE